MKKADTSDKLLRAVGKWVDAYGGNAVIAGNIGIMDILAEPLSFYVCIKVTGKRPAKKETP